MKKRLSLVAISLATVLVAGCGKTTHSVEWYQHHEAERKATLETCRADPAQLVQLNCRNAATADFHSGSYTPSPEKKW